MLLRSSPGLDYDSDRSSSPLPSCPFEDMVNWSRNSLALSYRGRSRSLPCSTMTYGSFFLLFNKLSDATTSNRQNAIGGRWMQTYPRATGTNILVEDRSPTHERAMLPRSSPGMDVDTTRSRSHTPPASVTELVDASSITLAPSPQGEWIPIR